MEYWSLVTNLIDIGIVAYFIYLALLAVRGTRAASMLGGLFILLAAFLAAKSLKLVTVSWILNYFLSSLFLVVVVLFQDEIRRALTKFDIRRFFRKGDETSVENTVRFVKDLLSKLIIDRVGAIIVFQGSIGVADLITSEVQIDSTLEIKLIRAIFSKNSPLHDGALIINGERIKFAGAILPLASTAVEIPGAGTRHSAALGLAEKTDSFIVVISEDTGSLAVAYEGKIERVNIDQLTAKLKKFLEG